MSNLADRATGYFPSFRIGTWANCVYCGQPSQCRDHVWSVKFLTAADRNVNRNLVMSLGPQALAYFKCNTRLGSKGFNSFEERCRFIANWKLKLAAKASAEWTSGQLSTLRGSLKKFVIKKQIEKRALQEQAQWFWSDAFFRNLESLLYEPHLLPNCPQFHEDYFTFFRTTIEGVRSCLDIGKAWPWEAQEHLGRRAGKTVNANATTERGTQEAQATIQKPIKMTHE